MGWENIKFFSLMVFFGNDFYVELLYVEFIVILVILFWFMLVVVKDGFWLRMFSIKLRFNLM